MKNTPQGRPRNNTMAATQLRLDQFTINSVLIFNPTFKPIGLKKAYEDDFQDAKLVYYYPTDKVVVQKRRNQVGLSEGMLRFIESQ